MNKVDALAVQGNSKSKIKNIVFIGMSVILMLVLVFLSFYKLGDGAIQDWDEARHGVNAYEMTKNKNYVITTYNYEVDYYNLKPPLSEYFILIGYRFAGYNVWGLRLCSAIMLIAAAIIGYIYALKKFGKCAAIWTLTGFAMSKQLFMYHCARNGDADALFVLLYFICTLALICNKENMRGFYIACFTFALAFLTKSWHAVTCAVLISSYFVLNIKKLKINIKKILISILCAVLPIGLWLAIRYQFDGFRFITEMINYDLLNRTSSAIEGHAGSVLYYFEKMIGYRSLFVIIPMVVMIAILEKKNVIKNPFIRISVASILIPVVLFSIAKTKLEWYIFCIFPVLVLLSAYGMQKIWEKKKSFKYGVTAIFVAGSMIVVANNVWTVKNIDNDDNMYSVAVFNMVERSDEFKGKNIYYYIDSTNEKWTQKDLLASELAGDFKCQDGGLESWKKDKGAYLVVDSDSIKSISENYSIVGNYGRFSIIKNNM